MRFQFRLEKFLNLVRMRETMKKMEVAAVIQKINFLNNRKAKLQDGIRALLDKTYQRMDPDWFRFQTAKIECDVKEQKKIDVLIKEEQDELMARQKELEALIVRRRSLEALREKRMKEHRQTESRRIQKQMDDLYQMVRSRS